MSRNLQVRMVLHYYTFGFEAANDAEKVSVHTAPGKDNDQQNISK